jgi:hypothetical protein
MKLAISVFEYMTYNMEGLSELRRREIAAGTSQRWAEIESAVDTRYQYGEDEWSLADADLDNDGKQELVLKYPSGPCMDYEPDSRRYSVAVFVLDTDDSDVAGRKTRQVLLKNEARSLAVTAESFDVFAYRGKTYVDRWENEGGDHGKRTEDKTLSVYLNVGDKNTLVCRYRYIENR